MPSYTRKTARTMASRRTVSRPRRRSAYATMSRPIRRYALNVNPAQIYKYQQYAYPVTLGKGGSQADGTWTSSNTNVIAVGTSVLGSDGLYTAGGVITPRLSNINGSSSFAGMYDQYRIKGLRVTVTPLANVASYPSIAGIVSGTLTTVSPIPELIICRDYDDTEVPSGATMEFELLERQDVKIHRLDTVKNFYMALKPRVPNVSNVTSGGVVTYGIGMGTGNEWIDINGSTLAYPSFKFVMRYLNLQLNIPTTFRIDCRYYIEFKNVR